MENNSTVYVHPDTRAFLKALGEEHETSMSGAVRLLVKWYKERSESGGPSLSELSTLREALRLVREARGAPKSSKTAGESTPAPADMEGKDDRTVGDSFRVGDSGSEIQGSLP